MTYMLSICQRIEKPTSRTVTKDDLSKVIFGNQVPIYGQDAGNGTLGLWKDVGIKDLIGILGAQSLLRMMISPSGVFGFYDSSVPYEIRDGRIFVRHNEQEVEVPYLSYEGEAQELMDHWANKTKEGHYIAPNETYYFRSIGGTEKNARGMEAMSPSMPTEFKSLAEVNLYISQKGSTTNLHCDFLSGAIHQIKGSKRIYLFPMNEAPKLSLYDAPHLLRRRSKHDGRLTQDIVDADPLLATASGYEIVLQAGQWLYMPRKWAHYVETLENDTVSLIVNFRA